MDSERSGAALLVFWNFLAIGGVFLKPLCVWKYHAVKWELGVGFVRMLNVIILKISSLSRILTFQMQMLILCDIFRSAVYYLAETLMSEPFLDEEYVAKASVINSWNWKLETFRDGLFFIFLFPWQNFAYPLMNFNDRIISTAFCGSL